MKSTGNDDWAAVVEKGKDTRVNPATDNETLGILAPESPLVAKLKDYKTIAQIAKNVLRPYTIGPAPDCKPIYDGGLGSHIKEDGRVHSSIRVTLETGRYASSDPNLMNLPKRREADIARIFKNDPATAGRYYPVRTAFIARPGHVLVEGDWNQAELWTMGYISGDEDFIHTLMTSDLHTVMMQTMFEDKLYQDKKIKEYSVEELNRLRKTDKYLESLRICAKTVNFGIPYGRGGAAIVREVKQEGVECTANEANSWIAAFFNKFQKVAAFLEACKAAVINPGFLENPYNRRRTFPQCSNKKAIADMQREAVNFPIQSTVGDAMSEALINLYLYRRLNPSILYRIIMSIHDAVILEVPAAHVAAVCDHVMPECMTNQLEIPKIGLRYTLGDFDISTRWGGKDSPEKLEEMGVDRRYCGYNERAA